MYKLFAMDTFLSCKCSVVWVKVDSHKLFNSFIYILKNSFEIISSVYVIIIFKSKPNNINNKTKQKTTKI
jgi:hypothetical protein